MKIYKSKPVPVSSNLTPPLIKVTCRLNKELPLLCNRSSRLEMFFRKGVLRNFTGKHQCQSLFFINIVAGLRPTASDVKKSFIVTIIKEIKKISPSAIK